MRPEFMESVSTRRQRIVLAAQKNRDEPLIVLNHDMFSRRRWEVAKLWRKWLVWRNRGNSPNWEKFNAMLRTFPLLPARIVHSRL